MPVCPCDCSCCPGCCGDCCVAGRLRYLFISAFIVTAQNGFGLDVDPLLHLCRETWGEEVLWDAVKDLPHGLLKLED